MTENQNFSINICGIKFSPENPLIIAELGTSHNGCLNKAKDMVNAAKEAGALCIKLQMVYAEEILHPDTGFVELPGGKIALYDRFKDLECPYEFYAELKEYIEKAGLLFLCTPFGLKSASLLKKLIPKMIKIASPELNYTGLLDEIAGWNIPALLSTGVSLLKDIENAAMIFKDKETPFCLLHCVTSYPAPETEYNLRILPNLSGIFGVPAGVSDHSSDPCLIPALAVSMGACVIEKHFCLSRTDPGLDDPIALVPKEFTLMTQAVLSAAKAGRQETIARYRREKGDALIEQILGDGIKKLAPSEKANYSRTNRSIHALNNLKKGTVLKKEDYAVLRTEKKLRPGLEPCWENIIEGRTLKNYIKAGDGILFTDI